MDVNQRHFAIEELNMFVNKNPLNQEKMGTC